MSRAIELHAMVVMESEKNLRPLDWSLLQITRDRCFLLRMKEKEKLSSSSFKMV